MIEQLPDYIAKCDVPGSQGRHYGGNNNCMDGCLALVEHTTDGQKNYEEEMSRPRARRLRYNYQNIHWLVISI